MKKFKCILLLILIFTSKVYAAQNQKLVVLLDWFANPNHAPLFVAQERGFFKEEGLEVELIGPADPADPPKLVAAGKADIAITYQPQFIVQIEHGLPLIRIGTLIDKPLTCLVVLKEGPIKQFSDLKNKDIGFSSSGVNNITLKVMLEHHHLQLKDVNRINVHYDVTQALLSKKIDAVTGMMRNFELIQMELAGHPARAFYPEENGLPTYSELIFVARNDRKKDPRFVHFMKAVQKGEEYLQQHPETTWQQFAKNHPELNDELNRRAWVLTLPYFAKKPAQFNEKSWLRFIGFMQQNGLIKKAESLSIYAVDLTKEN